MFIPSDSQVTFFDGLLYLLWAASSWLSSKWTKYSTTFWNLCYLALLGDIPKKSRMQPSSAAAFFSFSNLGHRFTRGPSERLGGRTVQEAVFLSAGLAFEFISKTEDSRPCWLQRRIWCCFPTDNQHPGKTRHFATHEQFFWRIYSYCKQIGQPQCLRFEGKNLGRDFVTLARADEHIGTLPLLDCAAQNWLLSF